MNSSQSQIEDFIDSSQFSEIKQKNSQKNSNSQINDPTNLNFSLLQSQYEEAMTYVKQIDQINNQYNFICKENSKLKTQNDELQRRLELSIEINNELKSKLHENKEKENLNSNLIDLIEEEKEKHENEIQKLIQIKTQTEFDFKSQQKETQNLKEELNYIYNLISKKINKKFNSIDQLIEILNKETPKCEISIQTEIPNNNENLFKLKYIKQKKKTEKLKKSIIKLSKEYEESKENEIRKLNSTIDEIQHSFQKVQSDNNDMLYETKSKIDQMENQIKNEKKKTEELKIEIKKLTEEKILEITKQQQKFSKMEFEMKEKLENEIKINSEKLKEKEMFISNIKTKFILLAKNFKKIQTENYSLKNQTEILQKNLQNANSIIQSLTHNLNLLKSEKEQLFKQIKNEINEKEQNNFQLICQFDKERSIYQTLLNKQKQEIESIYIERLKILSLVKQLISMIKFYENYLFNLLNETKLNSTKQNDSIHQTQSNSLKSTIQNDSINKNQSNSSEFKNDLINKNIQIDQNQFPSNIQNQNSLISQNELNQSNQFKLINQNLTKSKIQRIPLTAWSSSNFPFDLIKKIIIDNSIELPDKIHKVICKITEYYQTELETKDETLKTMADEMTIQNIFLKNLSNILNENDQQKILTRINQINEENSKLLTEITQFDNFTQRLYKKLNIQNFVEIFNVIDKFKEKNLKQKSANKELIKRLNLLNNKYIKIQKRFRKEQKNMNDSFSIEKDQFKKENDQIQLKYKSLQNDYETLEKSSIENINKLKDEQKISIKEMTEKFEKEKEIFVNDKNIEIKKLEEINSNQKKNLKAYKETIIELKSNFDSQQNQLQQMKTAFVDLRNQFESQLKIEQEKHRKELNEVQLFYKNKNESLLKVLDKATYALNQSDLRNNQLIDRSNSIENENVQLKKRIKNYEEEIEKERKFHESKLKALQMTFEIENSIKDHNS